MPYRRRYSRAPYRVVQAIAVLSAAAALPILYVSAWWMAAAVGMKK